MWKKKNCSIWYNCVDLVDHLKKYLFFLLDCLCIHFCQKGKKNQDKDNCVWRWRGCGGGGQPCTAKALQRFNTFAAWKYSVGQNGLVEDTANKLRHVMSIKAQALRWHWSVFFPPHVLFLLFKHEKLRAKRCCCVVMAKESLCGLKRQQRKN